MASNRQDDRQSKGIVMQIRFTPAEAAALTDLQKHMASDIAEGINASLRWEGLTPEEAQQVLRFLETKLERGGGYGAAGY